MKNIADLLAEHPLFHGLDPPVLALVSGCGRNVHFDAGTRILHEGAPADTFYVLRGGRVALEVFTPGRGPVVIETLGPGDVLGWSWLFPPYRWHFDAHAADSVRAIALDGVCLREKCHDDPLLGYELTQRFASVMLDRLQATRLRLLDVYGDAHAG